MFTYFVGGGWNKGQNNSKISQSEKNLINIEKYDKHCLKKKKKWPKTTKIVENG